MKNFLLKNSIGKDGECGVDTPTSMSSVVTALQGILTTDAMFTNLSVLIPVLGGILIFSFTYRLIRRMISGAPKGKAKI